jgi:hypothetical protein
MRRSYILLAFVGLSLMLIFGVFAIYVINISLSSQVIPTVVNGIASSTSIMIGFSGTLIGLMFREINGKRELGYWSRVVVAFAIVALMVSAGQLFMALLDLATSSYIEAVRSGLIGLLASLCTFFGLAMIIVEKMLEEKPQPK